MRGLIHARDESGAIAVIVAVSMVALVGMAAMVIDAGAVFQERRELQNGADAAALAIAEQCAEGGTCNQDAADLTAADYVDENALDDDSTLDDVELDESVQQVVVTASTATTGGGTSIAYTFAQVFGLASKQVSATATAAWGAPSAMTALPLTIEQCEYYKNESLPSGTPVVLTFHNPSGAGATPACPVGPSGQDAPGNFGWISGSSDCEAFVRNGIADGETGNDPECTEGDLEALLGEEVGVPVYSEVSGNGSNTTYEIVGFAGFELLGFRFPSMSGALTSYEDLVCSPPDSCIVGKFTSFVTTGEIDPDAPDFGVSVVELIPNP